MTRPRRTVPAFGRWCSAAVAALIAAACGEPVVSRSAAPPLPAAPRSWHAGQQSGTPISARPLDMIQAELAIPGVAARTLDAVPAVGTTVPVRDGVWPDSAAIVGRHALGAEIATRHLPLDRLAGEVRCTDLAAVQADRRIRMVARLVTAQGTVQVRSRFEVEGAAGCRATSRATDRLRAFAVDVLLALQGTTRQAGGHPFSAPPE